MMSVSSTFKTLAAAPCIPYEDKELNVVLDLAYILPKLVACSGPRSEFPKTMYRNTVRDVKLFLDTRHPEHWRVYNLREDDYGYDDAEFDNKVVHFPFPDHNVPKLVLLMDIIESLDGFLEAHADNTALIHCKAGKGRTGTVTCCYLMYKFKMSWQEAIELYTRKRMRPGFGEGVSIMSQRRYVRYFGMFLNNNVPIYRSLTLTGVMFRTPENFHQFTASIDSIRVYNGNLTGSCRIYISEYPGMNSASEKYHKVYSLNSGDLSDDLKFHSTSDATQENNYISIKPYKGSETSLTVQPDIKISCYQDVLGPFSTRLSVSFASFWVNLPMETSRYASKKLLRDTTNRGGISNTKNSSALGESEMRGKYKIYWHQMDGFKGTSTRGLKMFDAVELLWHLIPLQDN